MKSFAAIVIGSTLATCAAAAPPPVIGGLERTHDEKLRGAVLISELGCVACHKSKQAAFAPKSGPDLSEVGGRVQGMHLQKFIADPSGVKPGTTMPDALGHLSAANRDEVAKALAHYLATLGKPAPSTIPASDAIERGRKLYHSVGCVACHSPEKALDGSVPLGPLADKYTLASLATFLKDPLAVRPGGRMPDCHLEDDEAMDLASYLLREQAAPAADFQPDAKLAARGRVLFAEHHCHACHRTGETATTPELPALESLRPDAGCLSTKPGKWPLYALSDVQRASLRSALAEEHKAWTPAEQVRVTITRLNCIACHQRDDLGGVTRERNVYFTGSEESLGEQGRMPPPLTGVGAKLKEEWLRQVVCNGASARPSLHTRMPKFGAVNTEPLVTWMKQLDTLPPAPVERVPNSARPQNIGRDLVGVKGLNCIACHSFRGRSAAIRGPELTTLAERLEENWFHHFLAHPQRFAALTVMPSYWPDGKSPLPDVLGGDPRRQRDAIWQYLAQGPEAREPEGLVLAALVIEVRDEAVIVRRAFPGIGKRGLGVGYPGGINLAFDSSQMRLASLWSGGFIEASGLWRGQGSGQARLLGKDPVQFPPGPAFAVLPTPATAWPEPDTSPRPSPLVFKGYSLDAQQRPTLRYAMEGFIVEDFFHERRDDAGRVFLERTLRFPSARPSDLHFRVAREKTIEPHAGNLFAVGTKLLVRLPAEPLLRAAGDAKELILPVHGEELKIEYHLTSKP
ncbi:cytochrome c553 [Roseimicrobium gellanilyticum]|uniref:Cytochrome c553 n=1 Tax=Roseimicrobium gellanilyticum TaxID=748857 RepID=A0A366H2Y6_9BACT|nr:c-type cytochrome [Roseimicrobium gellanilyticum]RBP35650.1 cytochrome c553 [Roseimicrobium gellanilyticum]